MTDIFLSYSREDRPRIEKLAAALEQAGFSVWWDRHIAGGSEFSRETETQLNEAKIVVVAWSKASVSSMWVADEATVGRDKGNLVPIAIDDAPPKLGFRQVQTIDFRRWNGDPAAPAFAELLQGIRARLGAPAPPQRPVSASWRKKLLKRLPAAAIAGAILLALAAGMFFLNREAPDIAAAPAAAAPSRIDAASIAVLPFADLSPGGDQEYFSDGIAEEILHVLAGFPGLKVAGRTSSFKFKGVNEDLRIVGQQLGVAYLLEGSVRKQGERVRITAQLIKAEDGFHLWSETFDRDLTDIFAVQDEISRAVAEALSLRIGGAAAARGGTASPAAHDLSLRARQSLNKRGGAELKEAAALFAAATELDPDYSAAHSGRARALSLIWDYYYDSDAAIWEEAKRSADAAVAADPSNAEAYSVLGYLDHFYFWDWANAEHNVRRALELAPNDAEIANFAGDYFIYMLNFEEGFTWEKRAAELDPLHAVNFMDLSWRSLAAGRCEDALSYVEKTLEIDPNFVFAVMARTQAEKCLNRFGDAQRSIKKLANSDVEFPILLVQTGLDFAEGNVAAARRGLEKLKAEAERGEIPAYAVALQAAALGDFRAAGALLERAYRNREAKFVHDFERPLPEDWPDDPAIRKALDKPELNALFEIRRKNLAAHPLERPGAEQ